MNWHTETRKISELKNWGSNPRTISEESYKELKESIGSLGNFEPLVINVDGTVLAGNQRLRVAKEKGDKEVEVSVPERELTEQEIKKIGIISNRHSGEWDMDKLANEFEDILEELGFDDLLPEVELEVKEDDYEEPEDLETTVVLGDVYQLGEHRLMCGDSTNIGDVEKLMNGDTAQMIFTSPPYNIASGLYNNYNDDLKSDEYIEFNVRVLSLFRKYLSGFVFWNISYNKNSRWEFIEIFYRFIKELKLEFLENIVWYKPNAQPILSKKILTRHYENILLMGTEDCIDTMDFIFIGNTNKTYLYNKKQQKSIGNFWDMPVRGGTQIKEHQACMPVSLPFKAISIMSGEGDKVIDMFGGSGSTLIACEQTDRKCYMMELDPHYCQVIIDRWEEFTGKEAIKLE
jgi:site-specific DNA-methyltransferase (adenine-specific)